MYDLYDLIQAAFDDIWSTGTIVAAVVTGFALGVFFIGYLAAAPTYASVRLTAARTALFTTASTLLTGIVFWTGQAFAAYLEGDPGWPRVLTRYVLWVVWGVSMGLGTYARLTWHDHRRRGEAQRNAEANVADVEAHGVRSDRAT